MATNNRSIQRYISAFGEISKFISESEAEFAQIEDMSNQEIIEEVDSLLLGLKSIIEGAITEIKYDPLDEEIFKEMAEEENTRNVPIEPYARAKYVLGRIKSDYERYMACRQYNISKGVNVRNKEKIKFEYKMLISEYYDFQRDFNFIRKQLESNLGKHKPVFEQYYMKGITLEEYAKIMKPQYKERSYLIKWAYNKKESFIKALGRAYANEMSSMTYYDGIQRETGIDGRSLWALEREMVCDALLEVDNGKIDYFEAMKNTYIYIYEVVEKMRENR